MLLSITLILQDLRCLPRFFFGLAEESERIGYGKLVLEVTVSKGRPTNLQAIEVKRSFNLNA